MKTQQELDKIESRVFWDLIQDYQSELLERMPAKDVERFDSYLRVQQFFEGLQTWSVIDAIKRIYKNGLEVINKVMLIVGIVILYEWIILNAFCFIAYCILGLVYVWSDSLMKDVERLMLIEVKLDLMMQKLDEMRKWMNDNA